MLSTFHSWNTYPMTPAEQETEFARIKQDDVIASGDGSFSVKITGKTEDESDITNGSNIYLGDTLIFTVQFICSSSWILINKKWVCR